MIQKKVSRNPAITNANKLRGQTIKDLVFALAVGNDTEKLISDLSQKATRASSLGFQDSDLTFWANQMEKDSEHNHRRSMTAVRDFGHLNARHSLNEKQKYDKASADRQSKYFGLKSRACTSVLHLLNEELERRNPVAAPVVELKAEHTRTEVPASAPIKLKVAKKVKKFPVARMDSTDACDSFEALADIFKRREA